MPWPPHPLVIALWLIGIVWIALAAVAWRRRTHTRGARSFAFFALAGAVWALAEGMQAAALEPDAQLRWMQLKYLGIATLPVAFVVFANAYTRQVAWVSRLVVALLLAVPAVTVVLAWSYPALELLWRSVEAVDGRLLVVRGDWFWVHTASSYALLVLGSFFLLRGYVGTPRRYRAQLAWVLVAVLVPWATNVAVLAGGFDLPVDLTPLTFAVSAAALSYSLFTHRMLDIVPVARETVMRHLGDAIVVFDPRGVALQVNPAAAGLLGLAEPDDAVGLAAAELFADQPALLRCLGTETPTDVDLSWRRAEPARWFNAQVVPLSDRRGRRTGHLVRLQDVGRQVQAERTLRRAERRLQEQEAYLQALREVTDGLARRAPVDELLDAVLRHAASALRADHGFVHLVDPGAEALVQHGALGRFADLPPIVFKRGEGLAGRAWAHQRTVRVDDYARWLGRLRGVDLEFVRSAMAAPLTSAAEPLGAIALARGRDDRQAFREDEEDLLARFAQLGAIALEQVRLIEEIEARRRESDQLSRIGTAMQEPTSLQERVDLVLQAIQEVVGLERAVVWLPSDDGQVLEATSWIGFEGDLGATQRLPLDGCVPLLEAAFREGQEMVLDGAAPVPARWRARRDLAGFALLRSRAPAVLPLVSRGRVVGVLAVDNPYSRRPLHDKLPVLRRFAASAAVAIDSARLYQEVQDELVERRTAEAQLRRSEEKYRTILETMQEAYFEADLEGVLRLANPAFAAGLAAPSVDELLGRPYRKFVDPRDFRDLTLTVRAALGTDEPVRPRPFRFRRRDGGVFHGEVSISLVRDADGRVTGFRGLVRDVTERQRYEAELRAAMEAAEAANATKSSFLANVSHELRTPLTSILGFARLIERRFDEVLAPVLDRVDDPKVRRAQRQVRGNAGIIYAESQRLTHLINDVLDLAKIEAGRVDWHMAPLDPGEVARRAAEATHGLFEQKPTVRLRLAVASGLPSVVGDRDRLTQVVINLISNAVKFTAEGEVTVVVEGVDEPGVGRAVRVRVRDDGIGIAPEDHDTVFERFRQVGDTLTDKPQGTGLGLPICRQIVEHHGGRLWVESELGEGATFAFLLPLVPAAGADAAAGQPVNAALPPSDPQPPPPDAAEGTLPQAVAAAAAAALRRRVTALVRRTAGAGPAASDGHGTTGTTVLVVDDDARVRALLRQELEGAGHAVAEAADGRAALDAVRRHRPDLVVLDVMMPELDGFDVAAVLKGDPDTARIPLVILSVVHDHDRGVRLGVDRTFTKPVDVPALLSEVDALLRERAAGTCVAVVGRADAAAGGDGSAAGEALRALTEVGAALQEAGFQVVRLPDAAAVTAVLEGRDPGRPQVVVAAGEAAREGELAGRLRDAGVPLVMLQ